ncbi:unnamed protein product [Amoebophrya sp. A25]|nr:unnamed protein product [Amoebophrya sp. A25]|eukprot:GSA25T00008482001.1
MSSGSNTSSTNVSLLYRGFGPMVTQVSCKAAIRFAAFEQLKFLFAQQSLIPSGSANFLCGVGAGIIEAAVWVTPTERLKVLRQASISSSSSRGSGPGGAPSTTTAAARELLRTQGIGGFFVGFVPTAARQGVAMGIRFALYDQMKMGVQRLTPASGDGKTPMISKPIQLLLAGMGTGVVSSLANQPIDTAKSRLQAVEVSKGEKYAGTIDCLRKMYQKEGFLSWYAGCGPRTLRLMIGQGIIFSCQETISSMLHERFAEYN